MAAAPVLVVQLIALLAWLTAAPLPVSAAASAKIVLGDGGAARVVDETTTTAGGGLEPTNAEHGNFAMLDHRRALLQQTGQLSRSWNCYATVAQARLSFKWVGNDVRRKHSRLVRRFGGKYRGSQLGTIVALPPGNAPQRTRAERAGFGVHFQQYIYAADHKQALADLQQYWGSMFKGSKFYTGVTFNSGSCGEVRDTDGATHNGRLWVMRLQPGICHEQVVEYIDCAVIPAIKNKFGKVTFAAANGTDYVDLGRNAAPMFASDLVLSAATYVLKTPGNMTALAVLYPNIVTSNDTPVLLFQGLGYGVMSLDQEDFVKDLLSARVDLISLVEYRPQFVVVDTVPGDVLRVWSKLV